VLIEKENRVNPGEAKSVLVELFGNSPEVRLLDFFLDSPLNDHMQSEIARRTGMNQRTIARLLPKMLEKRLIVPTRKIAKARLYQLNAQSPLIHSIRELEKAASEEFAEQLSKQ